MCPQKGFMMQVYRNPFGIDTTNDGPSAKHNSVFVVSGTTHDAEWSNIGIYPVKLEDGFEQPDGAPVFGLYSRSLPSKFNKGAIDTTYILMPSLPTPVGYTGWMSGGNVAVSFFGG